MNLHAKIVGVISCAVSEAVWVPVYESVKNSTRSNVLICSSAYIAVTLHESIFKNATLTINKYIKNYEFKEYSN